MPKQKPKNRRSRRASDKEENNKAPVPRKRRKGSAKAKPPAPVESEAPVPRKRKKKKKTVVEEAPVPRKRKKKTPVSAAPTPKARKRKKKKTADVEEVAGIEDLLVDFSAERKQQREDKVASPKARAVKGSISASSSGVVTGEISAPKKTRGVKKSISVGRYKNKIVGFCFASPLMVCVLLDSDGYTVNMIDGTTPALEVRKAVARKTQNRVILVHGAANLAKLGKYSKPNVRLLVFDRPEVLNDISSVVIADAKRLANGQWEIGEKISPKDLARIADVASYKTPVDTEEIAAVLQSFKVEIPTPIDGESPLQIIRSVISQVAPANRKEVQNSIWRYAAGLIEKRAFSAAKRLAVRKYTGDDKAAYKNRVSNLHRWFMGHQGSSLAKAYQIVSQSGLAAAVAAGRVDADLSLLTHLIQNIPPSRRQQFVRQFPLSKED